ncbi:unnamed protein product [Sympodiomycopsis kandeliae]
MKGVFAATFAALALGMGVVMPVVDAAEVDHPNARYPSPSSKNSPSSFQIRRRSLQHHNIAETTSNEKRLLNLIPGLGDAGKDDGEAGQDSQGGSGASGSSSPSSGSSSETSQSSSGQWLRIDEHAAQFRRIQSNDRFPSHFVARQGDLITPRQLLSGVGNVIGGVADGIGGAVSGVGNAVGNAVGGSDDNGSNQGSSSSSSDGDGGDNSSAGSSSSSSPPPSSPPVSTSGSGSGNSVSNAPSSNRKPTSASSSQATSENSNPGPSANSASSSAAAAQRQSSSAAAAAQASQASESAAAQASQASQSAAAQASSLSASAARGASASAASIASESVNNAIAATSIAAASSSSSPVLISTSVPGGTTVITSIDSLQPTGTADVYGGANGSGRGGSSDSSQDQASSNDGKLSTAAIVGIAVPIGVIACIVIIWTVIRKRQQANTRALHPLDFTPAYGSADGPNDGLTRRSQESWLGGGGGRRMSGISDVEPDMMPPMEEMSHDDHMMRSGSHGGHFYNESMALSVPPTVYSAAAAGGAGSRRLSVVDSANSHGFEYADGTSSQHHQYYDGSSAAGYQPSAVRGVDLAGLQRSGTGGSASPYPGTQRGDNASMRGYDFRPDLDEPVRPTGRSEYEEAYADTSDPFQNAEQPGASAMTKSSSRWSG